MRERDDAAKQISGREAQAAKLHQAGLGDTQSLLLLASQQSLSKRGGQGGAGEGVRHHRLPGVQLVWQQEDSLQEEPRQVAGGGQHVRRQEGSQGIAVQLGGLESRHTDPNHVAGTVGVLAAHGRLSDGHQRLRSTGLQQRRLHGLQSQHAFQLVALKSQLVLLTESIYII